MDKKYYKELFQTELFENCLPFWLTHGRDTVNGGIYTCLDRKGDIYSTDKSVWMQGRTAYIFARLCNQFGANAEWLALSKSCLDFLNAYCIDPSDGRMYFTVTAEGKPLRKRRYRFSETFYIIASAEYYAATGDLTALQNARKYYDFVCGIYDDASRDPYKITPKSYAETRATKALAEPMILLNVTAVLRAHDPENQNKYAERARALVEDIKAFNVAGTGFMLESVGLNGEYFAQAASQRIINPGHSIELSWFLLDEANLNGDKEVAEFAAKVFNTAFDFGWDKEYGGILYFRDLEGKPVEAYEHDMKLWWPHNEAIIAGLKLFLATGEKRYWKIFEDTVAYAFDHFSDPQYGEWYGYLRRDGKPTEPPCKGHTYKGPFHVPRMLAECIKLLG